MREDILECIQCPTCASTRLDLSAVEHDAREIREGHVTCLGCHHRYPIHKGVLDLLPNPTRAIERERTGWVEMLGEVGNGLAKTMLELPYLEDDVWFTTHHNFDQVVSMIDVGSKRVVDIGAGRCWSTRHFMRLGASYAVAIDILTEPFIGLETADIFLEHDGTYFERVVADMNDLPVRPGVFDVVFMTGTLHHSSHLGHTMRGVARALAAAGVCVIVNEPVVSLLLSDDLSACPETKHGINENVYTILEYMWAARKAGVRPRLFFPRSIARRLDDGDPRAAQEMGRLGHFLVASMWRNSRARRSMCGPLLPLVYLVASMPLVMIGTKL